MCWRAPTCSARFRIWRCSEMAPALLTRSDGQATVEAAFLVPTLLLTMGLLLEPACLLYTRMVMGQAAAETARLLVTSSGSPEVSKLFCLRRLAAIPEVSLFHVGGSDDWDIELSKDRGAVSVSIRGHARPLPLLGLLAGGVLGYDGQGVILSVRYEATLRPSWLGGDAHDWATVWDG